jgi:ELWxxDGT repeat protein
MATFVVFAGIDSAGRNELWKTDGTASGTSEITSGTGFGGGIFSNTSPGLLQIRNEVIFNGKDANGRVGCGKQTARLPPPRSLRSQAAPSAASRRAILCPLTKAGPATVAQYSLATTTTAMSICG